MISHPRSESRRRSPRPLGLAVGLAAALLVGCGGAKLPPKAPAAKAKTQAKPKPKAATNAVPAKPQVPQSAFVNNLKEGIDPFFPNSSRRKPKAPASSQTHAAPSRADPYTQIVLNGILGTARRRIAAINDRPFETGEAGEITLADGQHVRLHCLRINESSVVVSLERTPDRQETVYLRKQP
jgi:hypothetical protein